NLLVTIEDPTVQYHLFSSCTLKDTYDNLMKVRRKKYFVEFAAVLLQRTMEESNPDVVLDWGQSILHVLSRRDEILGLSTKHWQKNGKREKGSSPLATKKSKTPQQNMPTHKDIRGQLKRKLPLCLQQNLRTNREMRIVEDLLGIISSIVQRHKKLLHLRNLIAEDRPWRSLINYCMAMAHLAKFYQALELMQGGQLEKRYSHLDAWWFSLAFTGVIMKKDSLPSSNNKVELKRDSSLLDDIMAPKNDRIQEEAVRNDVSVTKDILDEREGSFQGVEHHTESQMSGSNLLLDSVKNAALYLRRAMVLAHRGNHWTTLQYVCQTVWDQNHQLTTMIQTVAMREISPPPVRADQLPAIFTPLLVLATDLMLDMLDKLEVWSLYDLDSTADEVESRLHFSAPLDDCFLVDLRWVRTLVLHTLEQLHDCGKWETLAHFALLYNSYTRERYALTIVPLLIHSQIQLLDRISSFGGPAVPQPHHVKTKNTTGKEITNRSYAGCQLLSGWTWYPAQKQPIHKNAAQAKSLREDALSLKEYLQGNGHDSLKILALHEMGNLHFYAGNISAAHSCWSKAVDCAFQSSHVIQKWDGVSFESGSLQNRMKQAGIWGCLQGAVLTAKIAQFVLISDISERTKCCLLSAHFFKCVLCCSLAHPQSDLQYASHTFGDELFPGIDLFSEPHRLQVGTTVTSLHFVCHWLFTTGYYITLLPILALYLHLVGPVCRDVQRHAEARILKVRALTEMCMFTEAIREVVQLTQGADIILPPGHYITKANLQPLRTFCSNKSLPDNVEALEDLVNCDFTLEVCTLYGPTLCSRFNLARIQLILAITKSERGSPVSDSEESGGNMESREVDIEHKEQEMLETEGSSPKAEKPKVVTLCNTKEKLSPERIKFLLLEGASTLLSSAMQQVTSHICSEAENLELSVEFNLLKTNLCLQQGNFALSSEIAVSSLVLLQTSPVIVRQSPPGSKQDTKECSESNLLHGDDPRAVEACERIGVLLWLRCRLNLVHSLAANISGTATLFPGLRGF
ncbi:hypothetical protein ILYODFUR_018722, partial [Ilyodon furcidens]